jgi:hypothetical protein
VAECGALQKFLIDAGLSIVDKPQLPELVATLEFSDKPNSSRTLVTSRATIKLRQGNSEMVEQPQGVGRDAESAHVKAISKLHATRVINTFASGK